MLLFFLVWTFSKDGLGHSQVSKLAYPNNLDEGHLEYYYYVNAALALIGIGMYYAVTRSSGEQEVHATVQE